MGSYRPLRDSIEEQAYSFAAEFFPQDSVTTNCVEEYLIAGDTIAGVLQTGAADAWEAYGLHSDQLEDHAIAVGLKKAWQFRRWVESTGFDPCGPEVREELAKRMGYDG